MENDKIGLFIKRLREEKNLTQENLANLIPIGRGAVSKWERGITIPDAIVLVKLSEIFDVSINEILAGERVTKDNKKQIDNIALKYYTKSNKFKKSLIITSIITIVLFISFLLYYFCILYKSINVYRIYSSGYNFEILDGLFVNTNYKKYFRIENIKHDEDITINRLSLYYLDKHKEKIILYETDEDNITLSAVEGYDISFDKEKIKYILKSTYLDINYNDNLVETIKIDYYLDYVNSELFFKKDLPIGDMNNKAIKTEKGNLAIKIQNTFKDEDGIFSYIDEFDNYVNEFLYFPNSNEIILFLYDNNQIIKEWNYQIEFDKLDIYIYKDKDILYQITSQKGNIECVVGICKNEKEDIDYFFDNLYKIL